MVLPELTMPVHEAKAAFNEYRTALKRQHNIQDRALMQAYRALAERRRIIDIIGAMQTVGVDERHRPRLAIVRADVEVVHCRIERDGAARFSTERWERANASASTTIRLPPRTFPVIPDDVWMKTSVYFLARVPLIPPRFRPPHALSNYFLLWEAEWQDVPKDPILLRHLGKNLYAVLAQWDLTPVEQAVLRARPRV